jgi:hypothetical protein
MSNPSNLYAEKVYSEHPTILWALDDTCDYLSLLSASNSDLSNWTLTNGSVLESSSISSQPFLDSPLFEISGVPSTTTIQYTTLTSPELINMTELNDALDSFAFGLNLFSSGSHLYSVSLGYEYNDVTSGSLIQRLKEFPINLSDKWIFLSETFLNPNQNTTMRLVIKIGYSPSPDGPADYKFLLNGINLGQWSEEFISSSSGLRDLEDLPSNIALETCKVVSAKPYGLSSGNGYYLSKSNALLARNFGVPLVYGALNSTVLSPNNNLDGTPKPSLIVPGIGFMNESGRYKEYTLEFWTRATSDSPKAKRIFGPISGSDGLYVDGAFLTLSIGDQFDSKYVGEWGRPMLIQVTYYDNKMEVILNGEAVISLTINTSTLELPSKLNSEGKDQDWLGFYSYDDIYPLEVDCVAIYPYNVPEIVAKRRWTYGQAVTSTERINNQYNGTSAFIDYAFANYDANYKYPQMGAWSQGTLDNVVSDGLFLSTPSYSLPDHYFVGATIDNLYQSNKDLQPVNGVANGLETNTFISLSAEQEINGYLKFNNLGILTEKLKAIFGVFKVKSAPTSEQVLFIFENRTNSDTFKVSVLNQNILYKIKVNGTESTVKTVPYTTNDIFAAGFDIDNMSEFFGKDVSTFFGNLSLLTLYVLNDKTLSSKFTGNLYRMSFASPRNFTSIASHFGLDGVCFEHGNLVDHVASYTLIPTLEYEKFYLDIGVSGYWEDYIPLSYFAKYIKDSSGKDRYDLDFIQFNIDYPSPSVFRRVNEGNSWTYRELNEQFADPVPQTYEVLDNSLYTGYQDYDDLAKNRSLLNYEYNTADSIVRSYVSFQFIADGANKFYTDFTNTAPALREGIIDIQSGLEWQNTKYEVVNDTVIYPPKSVDFNDLAIVAHLEFKHKGILGKQVKLRSLEFASQSLNESSANPIGTKFGKDIFPYTKSGIYYDYKSKNPISIYKKSTPYLYLTRYSGIQVRGDFDPFVNRGISIPINSNKTEEYRVNSMQLALRYDNNSFPVTPYEIFEIKDSESTIKFFMVANSPSGDRAKIYAVNAQTGKIQDGISYYINGQLVSYPVITIKQWAFLGISFGLPLSFSGYSGYINLNGSMLFNHISYYQMTSLQQKQSFSYRIWDEVKEQYVAGDPTPIPYQWETWNAGYIWFSVLVRSSSFSYGITPGDIYRTYIGTNKIIIDSEKTFRLSNDPVSVYTESSWKQYISSPL